MTFKKHFNVNDFVHTTDDEITKYVVLFVSDDDDCLIRNVETNKKQIVATNDLWEYQDEIVSYDVLDELNEYAIGIDTSLQRLIDCDELNEHGKSRLNVLRDRLNNAISDVVSFIE